MENILKNKSKNAFKFWARAFFTALLIAFLLAVLAGFVMLFKVVSSAPAINPQNIEDILNESSFIYDSSGVVTEKIQSNAYRTVVPIEEIPEHLLDAFISIEDERFLEHKGVDFKRLAAVTFKGFTSGSFSQGASTITMQLSKNLFTSSERTLSRKLTDIYYASEIEKQLSKTEILHAYVNTVFLGGDSNGVQAASKSYFNKDVSELNLAECAMIAGITQYPSKYIPFKIADISPSDDVSTLQVKLYPVSEEKKPTASELEIYQKLKNAGKIDGYEHSLLKKGVLYAQKALLNEKSVQREHIVLEKMLELGKISQEEYEQAINTPIKIEFPPRDSSGISSYFNDIVKEETVKILMSLGNSEDAARDMLKNGGLRIFSTMNTDIQKILEKEYVSQNNFPGSYVDKDGIVQPQSAMVIIDQHTGEVAALIGGREQAGRYIFNRALSPRQPGSSIKPLAVYLPALEKGKSKDTTIVDEPRKDASAPGGYWPKNMYGQYWGRITLTRALEVSSNVTAVRVLESLEKTRANSIDFSLDGLQKMGFTTLVRYTDNPNQNDENLSLALGGLTKGVTPLEMTAAYSGIANLGKKIEPSFIKKIEDSSGNLIYESKPKITEIADPYKAYELTQMMVSVVNKGSGYPARISNSVVAGKTGTTTDDKDFWFVGFTPYYTASVWVGSDKPKELPGTNVIASTIWKNVMSKVQAKLPNIPFEPPKGEAPIKKEQEFEVVDGGGEAESVNPQPSQNSDDIIFEEEPAPPAQNQPAAPNQEEPAQPANPVVRPSEQPSPSNEETAPNQPQNTPIYEDIPPDAAQSVDPAA